MAARTAIRESGFSGLLRAAGRALSTLLLIAGCSRTEPPVTTVEVPGGGKPVLTTTERRAGGRDADRGEVAPASFEEPHPLPLPVAIKPLAEWTTEEISMDALGRIGAPAVPALVEVLRSGDAATRLKVVETLGRMGEDAKEAVPDLIRALDDSDAEVRKAAARTLGRIGPAAKEAVPALVRQLLESNAPPADSQTATAP